MRVFRSGIFLSSIAASPPSTVLSAAVTAADVPRIAAVDRNWRRELSTFSVSDLFFPFLIPTYVKESAPLLHFSMQSKHVTQRE